MPGLAAPQHQCNHETCAKGLVEAVGQATLKTRNEVLENLARAAEITGQVEAANEIADVFALLEQGETVEVPFLLVQ